MMTSKARLIGVTLFAGVVDGMDELREWLKQNHPETKPEDQ